MLPPSRWLRPFAAAALSAPALLLAVAAGASGAPLEGAALQEATTVTVRSFSYSPEPVEIRSGASVRWRWQGEERHSVTADDGSFDSDPACQDNPLLRENCRTGGDEDFVWTAPDVSERTEITYGCKLHASSQGMTGTVVVLPPAEPTSSPSEAPSRAPSPAATPSPSGGGGDDGSDTDDGDGAEDDRPPPRGPRTGAPPALGSDSGPGASPAPVAAPEVAARVDEPDLEPFPSPAPIPTDPEPTEELGEVAVDLPSDDGPLRNALLGVASVAVTGTAIAFGKLVLFGPRWR